MDRVEVFGPDGLHGEFDREELSRSERVRVRLDNGRSLSIPRDLLIAETDGRYRLPVQAGQLDFSSESENSAYVIPVVAEELHVSRRTVETGRVRVSKQVHERTELIDEPLFREEVQVERVPVDRQITEPISARYEGDVWIIPVMEEVLFVEKRLMLREEVRVSRLRTEVRDPKEVTLREEDIQVERDGRPAAPAA